MKVTFKTVGLAMKNWRDIAPLYKTLSDKKVRASRISGRQFLWLRSTYEGLFFPDSTVPLLARILNKHYRILIDNFAPAVLAGMSADKGVMVYQHEEQGSLKIFLRTALSNKKEGELYLALWKDDIRVFRMGFVIVDEKSIFENNEIAILITHIQGERRSKDLVREITKQFLDISLDRILLSSLIGFASYVNIKRLYGIPYQYQYIYRTRDKSEHAEVFKGNYDTFFTRFQAELENDFYSMPLPLPSKPLETLKHRKRTDLRRKLNAYIGDCVSQNLAAMNGKPASPVTANNYLENRSS